MYRRFGAKNTVPFSSSSSLLHPLQFKSNDLFKCFIFRCVCFTVIRGLLDSCPVNDAEYLAAGGLMGQ